MIEDFFSSWHRMVRTFADSTWAEQDGVVVLRTQLPVAPFNGVWQTAEQVSAAAVLAGVDELAAGSLPWNVQLRPGYPAELDEALASRGLTVTADIPFMTLPMTVTSPPDVSGDLEFRPAVTFDDVGEHLRLLEEAFGMPAELTRRRFPMTMLVMEGTTTWLGTRDGEVVTTAIGMRAGGSVGIFNVGTPEAHRGKGYGAAVTAQAIRASGATSAFLQSSPLGESVYRGLGFTTAEHWRQWMPTADVPV